MKIDGKAISVQAAGTIGTGVGKSLTVSLLCRLFYEDGYKVAPFKALNLTNVTYKDDEGREFGYSQALQAIAAGIQPDYRTNPFTPKPLGNGKFDLILEGKIIERYSPATGILKALREIVGIENFYERVMNSVKKCLDYLLKNYDIVCIEGSGPSKLLGLGYLSKFLDIPNMKTAELASAPVILISDSLDSLLLTCMLSLSAKEKEMVKGVILNRFSFKNIEREFVKDIGIPQKFFEVGIDRIEKEYIKKFGEIGVPEVIGYIPYLEELSSLPDLDPLFSDKKVDIKTWKEIIPKVAGKVRNKINLKKIYKIMQI
jgi:cobyric acid synthase